MASLIGLSPADIATAIKVTIKVYEKVRDPGYPIRSFKRRSECMLLFADSLDSISQSPSILDPELHNAFRKMQTILDEIAEKIRRPTLDAKWSMKWYDGIRYELLDEKELRELFDDLGDACSAA